MYAYTQSRCTSRLAWALALAPLGVVAIQFTLRGLGADPTGALVRWSGRATLAMLLAALIPGAVRRWLSWAGWAALRRILGLAAFAYALTHMLLHLGLGYALALSLWFSALPSERFVLVGLAALVILAALAATSSRRAQVALGANWRRLHRLIYLAGALAVWHAAWAQKTLAPGVIVAGIALALLLLARLRPPGPIAA